MKDISNYCILSENNNSIYESKKKKFIKVGQLFHDRGEIF